MMKKFRVLIDKSKCIGCGCCSEIEPNVFFIDEEGKSKVKIESKKSAGERIFDNTSGKYNKVEDAAKSCPVNAITVTKVNK